MAERAHRRQGKLLYILLAVAWIAAAVHTLPKAAKELGTADDVKVRSTEAVEGLWPTRSCGLGPRPYCGADWRSMALGYAVNQSRIHMCHVSLFRSSAEMVQRGVERRCVYHLTVGEREVPARLGVQLAGEEVPRIYTHFDLDLKYANGRVQDATLRQSHAVKGNAGDIAFSYGARWTEGQGDDEPRSQTWHVRTGLLINALCMLLLALAQPAAADGGKGKHSASPVLLAAVGAGLHAAMPVAATFAFGDSSGGAERATVLGAPLCGVAAAGGMRRRSSMGMHAAVALIPPVAVPLLRGQWGDACLCVALGALGFAAELRRRGKATGSYATGNVAAWAVMLPLCGIAPYTGSYARSHWTHNVGEAGGGLCGLAVCISLLLAAARRGGGNFASGAAAGLGASTYAVCMCLQLGTPYPAYLTIGAVLRGCTLMSLSCGGVCALWQRRLKKDTTSKGDVCV